MIVYRCDSCGTVEELTVASSMFSVAPVGGTGTVVYCTLRIEKNAGVEVHLCAACRKRGVLAYLYASEHGR